MLIISVLCFLNNFYSSKTEHFFINIEHFSLMIVLIRRLKIEYVTENSSY